MLTLATILKVLAREIRYGEFYCARAGNTNGGVPLTSCLTGLESAVWLLTIFVFYLQNRLIQTSQTGVNSTVILLPLVFPVPEYQLWRKNLKTLRYRSPMIPWKMLTWVSKHLMFYFLLWYFVLLPAVLGFKSSNLELIDLPIVLQLLTLALPRPSFKLECFISYEH